MRVHSRAWTIVSAVLWSLAIAACCSSRPAAPSPAERTVEGFRIKASELYRVSNAASRRVAPAPPRVLVLSGGGQHGAFGAGILRAWRLGQPDFDIVTGISTGSLQATAAYLGTEARLADLEQAYTTVDEGDVIEKRWWFKLAFSDSLATTNGLKALIERFLGNAVIDEVAAHHEQRGGVLAVGTTNLDAGTFVVWNMTAIALAARADPSHYDLYRRVVLASCSIPVFMTPVWIDGAMHFDGGVREQLFVRDLRDGIQREGGAQGRLMDATVIVNGSVCAKPANVEDCLLPIAFRALDIVLTEAAVGNLYKTQALLKEMEGRNEATYRLAAIPADFTAVPATQFDKSYMTKLFARGRAFAVQDEWNRALVPQCEEGARRL
jgi:predicted acylesterase/phospholipase RssA